MSALADPLRFLDNFSPYPGQDVSGWTGANFIVSREHWETYEWLVIVGCLMAFFMAWGIGANDVANAFATSVGAKTLKLWQAVIVAGIFEFVGAMVLGGEVVKTVKGGITSPEYFAETPELFAFGMLCALTAAANILLIATYLKAPVSTTHSIIGAVLGFGLIFGGRDAITWNDDIPEFPYKKGVVTVFLSWFVAPVLAGIISTIIFLSNRFFILRRKNSTEYAFWSFPFLVALTIFVNLLFVLMKGAGSQLNWDKEGKKASWVSAIVAAGCAVLTIPVVFLLKRRLANRLARAEEDAKAQEMRDAEVATHSPDGKDKANALSNIDTPSVGSGETEPRTGVTGIAKGAFDKVKKQIVKSMTMDIHEDIHKVAHIAAMHAGAEVFDPRTEEVYKYLQVFSACCVAFAHGANDVANSIAPLAGIWYVYQNNKVSSTGETPKWMFVLGGSGIVVGLATYGYNIIKVLGVELATMTPSRGFAAELATSLTISIATVYGLPVSTTQTITGAEVGVGLSENWRGTGLNWRMLLRTMFGWVISFGLAILFSAALYAFCVYSPSMNDLDYVENWQNAMTNVMRTELGVLNDTTAFPTVDLKAIADLSKNLTSLNDFKKFGKTNQYDMMAVLKNVTLLFVTNTRPQPQA